MIGDPPIKRPEVLGRAAWLARPPTIPLRELGPVRRIVVHHAAILSRHWAGPRTILAIQGNHQGARGFRDIAYHFIVSPDGTVWAGIPTTKLGSHCGGEPCRGTRRVFGNTGSLGVCVFGDFDQEPVPKPAYNGLITLLTWLVHDFNLRHDQVYGHFEAWSPIPPKTCPGKFLSADLFPERWARVFPANP